MSRKATAIWIILGILLGTVLKIKMLFYMGGIDMNAYNTWGKHLLSDGLTGYYPGIYYPVQMQLFEACAWVVAKTGISFFIIFKLGNLLFDAGSLVLVILLLKRYGANPAWALLYWIHPWFLTVFALGYVDFQFTFFVLLCLYLIRDGTPRDYLVAGLPLAAAFLMKPQTQILIIAVFCFGLLRYFRSRDFRVFGMLAAPVVLFLAYEILFAISGPADRPIWIDAEKVWPRSAAAIVLPASYLNITNIMPALTAQMPNIWSPIAYLIKKPDEPLLLVSDQIEVLPHLPIKYLAAFFVLTVVACYVWRIERQINGDPSRTFMKIFLFAALAVPFFMTSGHENHLFLATVLLTFLCAEHVSLLSISGVQILLAVQFFNMFSQYGEYPAWLARLVLPMRSDEWQVVFALVSLVGLALVLKPLWSERIGSEAASPAT